MRDIMHAAFTVTAQSAHSISTIGVETAAEALAQFDHMGATGAEATVQDREGVVVSRSRLVRLASYDSGTDQELSRTNEPAPGGR